MMLNISLSSSITTLSAVHLSLLSVCVLPTVYIPPPPPHKALRVTCVFLLDFICTLTVLFVC